MHGSTKNLWLAILGGIAFLIIAIIAFALLSNPGKAPRHKFDSFKIDYESCINAFEGKRTKEFTHMWVLHSSDLKAWWDPNGMRAEADLILDTPDQYAIGTLLSHARQSHRSPNHVRTLSSGRIYHVLLFNENRHTYAHLRFAYRSEQADGTTVFSLVTDHRGAHRVKDCPSFIDFESKFLANK
ncbi:hypothetical protein NT6N_24490 [Oceaniferula spumae]|uniref:SRPBCC family protein n=1 Tax=Oceaniferula spumae TaxID=2979115 RepID=A0AAT9FN71_9BACT